MPGARFRRTHEISRLSSAESSYLFNVRHLPTGRRSRAWLTYELFPNSDSERTLLLCDDKSLLTGDEERAAYDHLVHALQTAATDRIGRTKTIVNDIVDGTWRPLLVVIAVHKFGPVPVVVTRDTLEIDPDGVSRTVRFALFPKRFDKPSHSRTTSYAPSFASSRQQFRRSLTLAPDLTFQRYLEDIAEEFHDIRSLLKRPDIYRRARRIEQFLAQSVQTKLKLLIPRSTQIPTTTDLTNLETWNYFRSHSELLLEVTYARAVALLLLNRMYEIIGIASREEHYRKRVSEIPLQFQNLLGRDEMREIEDNSLTLAHLRRTHELAAEGATTAVAQLLDHSRRAPNIWSSEFAKFAAFTSAGREVIDGKPFARVFVSHHSDVPTTKVLRAQIQSLVDEQFAPRINTVTVEHLSVGSAFRHVIRSAIWSSHGTIAICPTSTKSGITTGGEKDYRWIAREVEHSVMLGRPVFIGCEADADMTAIARDFSDPSLDHLVEGPKLPAAADRAGELLSRLQDYVNETFSITVDSEDKSALDPRLHDSLGRFFGLVIQNAADEVLDGYVRQFEPDIAETMIRTLMLMGPHGRKPKSWIVTRLASITRVDEKRATTHFNAMTQALKKRRLHAGARSVSLIDFNRRRQRWGERLALVLRLLSPGVQVRDRKQWRERWLRRQCEHLKIAFPT